LVIFSWDGSPWSNRKIVAFGPFGNLELLSPDANVIPNMSFLALTILFPLWNFSILMQTI
jgi:hypothetical protein